MRYADIVPAPQSLKPLILCPLQYELKQLRRGFEDRFDFICTGPGSEGIRGWERRKQPIEQLVILAGLAGALTDRFCAGTASIIDEVVDAETGSRWKPTFRVDGATSSEAPCVITSSQAMAIDRDDRKRLHELTGAHLVDFESVAFARAATAAGLHWAIVRGVSDDLSTGVIEAAAHLVDEHGNTQPTQVLRLALRNPTAILALLRLARHSRRALAQVRILIGKARF